MSLCLTGLREMVCLSGRGFSPAGVWPIKWEDPHPLTHLRDSVWIGAGSFVSAFILALTKCGRLKERRQGYQRVRDDPPPLHGTTLGGELVTDPPIHGFILMQQAGKELSPLL